ncbi:hypothetical protein TorRG33x02_218300, partial [Trema orientale]
CVYAEYLNPALFWAFSAIEIWFFLGFHGGPSFGVLSRRSAASLALLVFLAGGFFWVFVIDAWFLSF